MGRPFFHGATQGESRSIPPRLADPRYRSLDRAASERSLRCLSFSVSKERQQRYPPALSVRFTALGRCSTVGRCVSGGPFLLKRGFITALWLVVSASMPSMISAQTPITYSQQSRAIFTVSMPDFWLARSGGPRAFEDESLGQIQVRRILALEPETNDAAWIGLASPQGITTLADARAYVANMGQFLVETPVRIDSFRSRVGGLPVEVINGQGIRERQQVRFSIMLADLPNNRVAILVALAKPGAGPGVIEEIRDVFMSIRAGG